MEIVKYVTLFFLNFIRWCTCRCIFHSKTEYIRRRASPAKYPPCFAVEMADDSALSNWNSVVKRKRYRHIVIVITCQLFRIGARRMRFRKDKSDKSVVLGREVGDIGRRALSVVSSYARNWYTLFLNWVYTYVYTSEWVLRSFPELSRFKTESIVYNSSNFNRIKSYAVYDIFFEFFAIFWRSLDWV